MWNRIYDSGIISALDYIISIGWYGYIGRLILTSGLNTFVKIIFIVGCLAFGFDHFIQHHMRNDE